jgi:hypothetical protein
VTCSNCGELAVVTITHTAKLGRRQVAWTHCVPCELRERIAGDEGADEAIVQAERAGA